MLLIIYFASLSWQLTKCLSQHKQTILSTLHAELNIETMVLYDIGFQDSLIDLLRPQVMDYPHVLIAADLQWQLKDFVNKPILSVVHVGTSENDLVLRVLKHSLNRRHLEYVFFITTELLDPPDKWLPLFEWCHRNGFIHSLLTDLTTNSLLTYDHFKSREVFNTSLKDFVYSTQHLNNLNGLSIRSTLGNNPPRALVWTDAHGSLHLSGYHLKSLDIFASYYNASLDFVLLSNLSYYSEGLCLKYLKGGLVDVCGDAMPMTQEYIISSTQQITHSYLVVPYDKPMEKFYYFVKPFQPKVWLLVQGSFVYKMLTLSLVHRLQKNSWNFGITMLIAVVSVQNLPFDLRWMKGWYWRVIEVMLISVGFMVSTCYLTKLSSLLFIRIYSAYITSLEDLENNNISIMVTEFEHDTLKNTDMYSRFNQLLMLVDQETLQYNRRNLIPSYAYYGQEDTNLFYLYQQTHMLRLRMKGLKHIPLNPMYHGIPVRPYWALEEKLSRHMSHMFESGLPDLRPTKTAEDAIKMGYLKYFPLEYNEVEPLSVEYFQMPAILLLSGFTMGFISFLLELLIKRLKA